MEWTKVNHSEGLPFLPPFLLCDIWGHIYMGNTAFDFYDAAYYLPIHLPSPPLPNVTNHTTITNDEWVTRCNQLP